MKNPNSPAGRLRRFLGARWSGEDYPGGEPRFQVALLAKDISIFILLPVMTVVLVKSCETAANAPKKSRPTSYSDSSRTSGSTAQVILFSKSANGGTSSNPFAPKRSPGTLVKLRLLNVVETYSSAPVHARIVDASLGNSLMGGTLVGDAVADSNFERINITFRVARDSNRESVAFPIAARALSLDGTLGLVAAKKEGAFTRSVYNAGSVVPHEGGTKVDSLDLKDIVIKALTTGLLQEFGSTAQVERNRSQVLTLTPSTEFFAELTDYFPGAGK